MSCLAPPCKILGLQFLELLFLEICLLLFRHIGCLKQTCSAPTRTRTRLRMQSKSWITQGQASSDTSSLTAPVQPSDVEEGKVSVYRYILV